MVIAFCILINPSLTKAIVIFFLKNFGFHTYIFNQSAIYVCIVGWDANCIFFSIWLISWQTLFTKQSILSS